MSSDEQEQIIFKAQSGNTLALEVLVSKHQGMIHMLASRMRCESMSIDDLIQAGNLGLMHAIEHYDVSKHTKLLTYAVPWILGEMRKALRCAEFSMYSLDKPDDEATHSLYDALPGIEEVNIRYLDLRLALSKLSRDAQILISLRYYRDKTQKECSLLLSKSQTQISRMESMALNSLREMLS